MFFNSLGVFSEYNIYFLCLLLFILFIWSENLNYYTALYFSPLFIYFSLYFKSIAKTKNISNLICNDLKSFNYYGDFCDGAILWLGYDIFETINITISYYRSSPAYITYIFYAALVLSPFFFSNVFKNNLILSVIFIFSFIPLFIISLDWGSISIWLLASLASSTLTTRIKLSHNCLLEQWKPTVLFLYIFLFLHLIQNSLIYLTRLIF